MYLLTTLRLMILYFAELPQSYPVERMLCSQHNCGFTISCWLLDRATSSRSIEHRRHIQTSLLMRGRILITLIYDRASVHTSYHADAMADSLESMRGANQAIGSIQVHGCVFTVTEKASMKKNKKRVHRH